MNRQTIFTVLLVTLFLRCGCDGYKFLSQGIDTTRYPFSGVGLVRDNPNDTIEIWYANATDKKGVNEVLHKVITRDTVVGLNESWITYEHGTWNGIPYRKFIPDYSEGGDHYFKICNKGKANIFYFIVPHPNLPDLENRGNSTQTKIQYQDQFIYDMIFKNGEYAIKNLSEISDLYKKHDKDNNTLFISYHFNSLEDSQKETLSRGLKYYSVEKNLKLSDKTFYYGIIYSGECMQANKNMGVMLENVTFPSYSE